MRTFGANESVGEMQMHLAEEDDAAGQFHTTTNGDNPRSRQLEFGGSAAGSVRTFSANDHRSRQLDFGASSR